MNYFMHATGNPYDLSMIGKINDAVAAPYRDLNKTFSFKFLKFSGLNIKKKIGSII